MAKGVCGDPGLACGEPEGGDLRRAAWGAPLASVRQHGGCVVSHDGVVVAAGFRERELVACQCTSRHMHGIVSGSLREYTDAWWDLTWSTYDKIDIPGCAMPQFSDGVIAYLSEDWWALTVPFSATPGPLQWYIPHATRANSIRPNSPLSGSSLISSSALSRPDSRTHSPPQAQPRQAPSSWPRASCSQPWTATRRAYTAHSSAAAVPHPSCRIWHTRWVTERGQHSREDGSHCGARGRDGRAQVLQRRGTE
ncbi:hypothetical protein EDB83DRAFT_2565790 [Lactarius deliciosus]|nr:hypothetical protein EDB83DRAFT_2565790 [Lactarius deliciosus]